MNSKISLALIAVFSLILTACGGGTSKTTVSEEDTAITVDSIFVNPDVLVGKTITVEGVCSHLCKHGGRKAFILGSDDKIMIRCDAMEEMGSAFPKESIHQPLRVTGELCEQRIDESTVAEMEKQHASLMAKMAEDMSYDDIESGEMDAAGSKTLMGCETERKAVGQGDISTFNAQIADYRRRIAERNEAEGKPYLSVYYMKATAYEILPE